MNENFNCFREKVVECFNNLGLVVDDKAENILEYLVDSVMYIAFIVELEGMFNVEIPDEYLLRGNFQTIENICSLLVELKQNQDKC